MEIAIIVVMLLIGVIWPVAISAVALRLARELRREPDRPMPASSAAEFTPDERRMMQQLANFNNYDGTTRNQTEIEPR